MANTLKLGAGKWATGTDTVLAFNDTNNNFKPLPFDFSRASSATVVNQSGLIETVGSGEPRIDFLGNTKGALLLEPQRTNLISYSQAFDNAAWAKNNVTVTSNAAISPDGTLNADLLNFTSSGNYIDYAGTITVGQTYTVSCYVKSAVPSNQTFVVYGNANKSSGTITATSQWQRFTHTFTADITAMSSGINSTALNQLYVWGFQLEEGSYATSYIPTSGSAVTRVAESTSQTVPDGVIGQTEGTIFVDFEIQTTGQDMVVMNISNSSTPVNSIYFYLTTPNQLAAYVDNGGQQVLITSGVLSQGTYKAALAYKQNDFAFYLNGNLVGVDNSGNVPTCSVLQLENYTYTPTYQEKTKISEAQLYNTRLSNAELQALTTI